jgi:hypothetical protein
MDSTQNEAKKALCAHQALCEVRNTLGITVGSTDLVVKFSNGLGDLRSATVDLNLATTQTEAKKALMRINDARLALCGVRNTLQCVTGDTELVCQFNNGLADLSLALSRLAQELE